MEQGHALLKDYDMDPRIPELHQAVCRFLVERATNFQLAIEILTAERSENLTHEQVRTAIEHIEADISSPLRATLFDLGRLVSGSLPTDDIVAPPKRLKIYIPEG